MIMEMALKAVILGIVEGITEFLPISSTGHLIICNKFINFTGSFANMFDVVIQLGAILSVVVYFWKRLFPFGKESAPGMNAAIIDTWKKTLAGVSPALVLGALFGGVVEERLFNPVTVAVMLLLGGIALIIIESRKISVKTATVNAMTYRLAIAVGLFQCIAMIPGTSRSAATIISAMLLGVSRVAAAEYSFFLAIPTMVAASGYSLLKTGGSLSTSEWFTLGVGFVVSFFTAWAVIALFMRYIQTHDFKPFGWYRIVLGVVVLVFMAFGK
jgi:undecaprenyl-diphosphatase